ncbi:MAG: DUF4093 domain-containing protein [Faecalibacterium sp.]|jgi:ribonuclease M5|nr:DUF4093 domain-containing protein [Faecalibacterium sp.]
MKEKLHTGRVVLVEGRYDAARLAGLIDADILTTDGFAIRADRARQQTLRRLAAARGLLILTDSDAAGFQIRTFVTNLAGEQNVLQAYIPACPGKEPRKPVPGKEGLLGVEGVSDDILRRVLATALRAEAAPMPKQPVKREITYTDLYSWGLSGTAGAAARKTALLQALGLPPRLSKKELTAVLNSLYTYEELDARVRALAAQTERAE